MASSIYDKSPETAYLKAIDLWLVSCFSYTFMVLLEYAIVLALSKPQPDWYSNAHTIQTVLNPRKRPRTSTSTIKILQSRELAAENEEQAKKSNENVNDEAMQVSKRAMIAYKIERWARFLLPFTFFCEVLFFFIGMDVKTGTGSWPYDEKVKLTPVDISYKNLW